MILFPFINNTRHKKGYNYIVKTCADGIELLMSMTDSNIRNLVPRVSLSCPLEREEGRRERPWERGCNIQSETKITVLPTEIYLNFIYDFVFL